MQAVKKTPSSKSSRPSRPARPSRRLTVYDVIDENGKILRTALSERDAKAFADAGNKLDQAVNAERIRIGKPAKPVRIWYVIASEFVAAR